MAQIILLFTAILRIYEFLMIIYILMSWIPESRSTQLGVSLVDLLSRTCQFSEKLFLHLE